MPRTLSPTAGNIFTGAYRKRGYRHEKPIPELGPFPKTAKGKTKRKIKIALIYDEILYSSIMLAPDEGCRIIYPIDSECVRIRLKETKLESIKKIPDAVGFVDALLTLDGIMSTHCRCGKLLPVMEIYYIDPRGVRSKSRKIFCPHCLKERYIMRTRTSRVLTPFRM